MHIHHLLIFALLSLLSIGVPAQAPLDQTLAVQANVPGIAIETRKDSKDVVRLPSLQYRLDITTQCSTGFSPTVLSLSVADTRRSFAADAIPDSANFEVEFTVPAAQIGPVTIEEFCVAEEDSTATSDSAYDTPATLSISTILSLQASLLCANETESQIVYASKSLDVALECASQPLTSTSID